jgi:hypothetical protein
MNAACARFDAGSVSIQNAGRWTRWAGRSLSYAHGSVLVPIANSPAGTSTSVAGVVRPAGSGALSSISGGPSRSWWVASIVSACCCSCWTTRP